MDYLKRDSFLPGVAEGNVNPERLIQMMNVVDDVLVIEKRNLFSRKVFDVQTIDVICLFTQDEFSGRVSIDFKILKDKNLLKKGVVPPCSIPLQFLLQTKITLDAFDGISYLILFSSARRF
jgi:hypothetical protein